MPHIRDPVTHRCVVCQLGRHPSPFPIGWRSGGLPHKCHQWERFEKRRKTDARDRYRRQIGSTAYTGPVVLEFNPPEVVYPSLDYNEDFVTADTDRSADQQQRNQQPVDNQPRRRRGGLRQSEPGTASLDQYHFFNDPLISRTRRSYAIVALNHSPDNDQANSYYGNRNVTFSEPPAIAVSSEVETEPTSRDSDEFVDGNRGADGGLDARFQRRQTRGAFNKEEFQVAVDNQQSKGTGRSLEAAVQRHQQRETAPAVRVRTADNTQTAESSTCQIL